MLLSPGLLCSKSSSMGRPGRPALATWSRMRRTRHHSQWRLALRPCRFCLPAWNGPSGTAPCRRPASRPSVGPPRPPVTPDASPGIPAAEKFGGGMRAVLPCPRLPEEVWGARSMVLWRVAALRAGRHAAQARPRVREHPCCRLLQLLLPLLPLGPLVVPPSPCSGCRSAVLLPCSLMCGPLASSHLLVASRACCAGFCTALVEGAPALRSADVPR